MDLAYIEDHKSMISSIAMIIIGIIILICPSLTVQAIGTILGLIVLLVAAIFLIFAITQIIESPVVGVISFIVSLIGLYFGWLLIFDLGFVTAIFSLLLYLIGIVLLFIGAFNLVTTRYYAPFSMLGISGIIFGILFLISAIFIRTPNVIAVILGIWLIISGILSLNSDNSENYIDVRAYK